jgi:hypothetical protein
MMPIPQGYRTKNDLNRQNAKFAKKWGKGTSNIRYQQGFLRRIYPHFCFLLSLLAFSASLR